MAGTRGPTHVPLVKSRTSYKRRAYHRSKQGCGNCRLRRVKCDEERPGCRMCRKAHIACTFTAEANYLQSSHEQTVTCVPLLAPHISSNNAALAFINQALYDYQLHNPGVGHVFELSLEGLSLLLRFQNRTVHSIGSQWDITIWDTELIRLVSLNPYLLHVVMACTSMHDRYLRGQNHQSRTKFECFHLATSAQLFNHEISCNTRSYDQDAIFMAATLMGWLVMYAVETQNPEEVWPLSSTISDIPWFPMQKGLRIIWKLAGPDRTDSLFFNSASNTDERCLGLPPPRPGIEGIPKALVTLCGLDESSCITNNPYYGAARSLSVLLDNNLARPQSLRFLGFLNTTDDGFEALLRQKDPRSLLLMSIWYGIVPKWAWWISLRASLERRAIFIYLDRYHAEDPIIHTLIASI